MENITINVQGMSCGHCKKAVEDNVGALNGVDNVDVALDEGKVTIKFNADNVTLDDIKETIEDQGYDVD